MADSRQPNGPRLHRGNEACDQADMTTYPSFGRLVCVVIALSLQLLCASLDNTILATAIPTIADHFHAPQDIGWYSGTFTMASGAVTLLWGRLYTIYSVKWTYLASFLLFELGSAICGSSRSSTAFIIGRSIAGLGDGGQLPGSLLLVNQNIPLSHRPLFAGIFTCVFNLGTAMGPLVGGSFTDKVSWRWCFYINLPIGALTVLMVAVFVQSKTGMGTSPSMKDRLALIDPWGNFLLTVTVLFFLLAIQCGGSMYGWGDRKTIIFFVLAGVLFVAMVLAEYFNPGPIIFPTRLFRNVSVLKGASFAFCICATLYIFIYYLPIWFQVVKGSSAIMSGVMSLPLLISVAAASLLTGYLVTLSGRITPFMALCPTLLGIGSGLLTTLTPDSSAGKWISYQILVGVALGLGLALPWAVIHRGVDAQDTPTVTALVSFQLQLGASVGLSLAHSIYHGRLSGGLRRLRPQKGAGGYVETQLTTLREKYAGSRLTQLIGVYNDSITTTLYVCLALALLAAGMLAVCQGIIIKQTKRERTGEGGAGLEQEEEEEDNVKRTAGNGG